MASHETEKKMRTRRRKAIQKPLDLNSLIDVIFILLLFVMVSVRFSEPLEKIAHQLPESELQSSGNILGIVISRKDSGDWFYAGKPVSEKQLIDTIQALSSEEVLETFLLELDPRSDFGGFVRLSEVMRNKGIQKIEIGVQKKN